MNGTTEHSDDFSSWDDLANELGLEPAAKPKDPKATASSVAPAARPASSKKTVEPEPQPEEFGALVEAEHAAPTKIEHKATNLEIFDEPVDEPLDVAVDESVADEMSEGPESLDDIGPSEEGVAEENAEAAAGGRRRRRRRRKKGGPKPDAAIPAEPSVESAPALFVAADDDSLDDEGVVIVGEAGAELEDDDEEEVVAAPLVEDLEEDSAEPLPEWKVVAWTDLIATLYRPQDRS